MPTRKSLQEPASAVLPESCGSAAVFCRRRLPWHGVIANTRMRDATSTLIPSARAISRPKRTYSMLPMHRSADSYLRSTRARDCYLQMDRDLHWERCRNSCSPSDWLSRTAREVLELSRLRARPVQPQLGCRSFHSCCRAMFTSGGPLRAVHFRHPSPRKRTFLFSLYSTSISLRRLLGYNSGCFSGILQ
jgi:hypothetical protein